MFTEEARRDPVQADKEPFYSLGFPETICTPNVGYSWGIIRVGSLLPTRFSFPHAILMRFNPNRIVAN